MNKSIHQKIQQLEGLADTRDVTESLKLCECGCGQRTKKATYTKPKRGIKKGEYLRFVRGHQFRGFKYALKHGMKDTRTYQAWVGMKNRCLNKNNKNYADYGGRGITVCERWLTFENFYADMGNAPLGLTLDRYPNNDRNYEPGNCRWATRKEQSNNQRVSKTAKLITYQGETLPLAQWAKRFGINKETINSRLSRGWTIERAFTEARSKAGRRGPP